MDNFPNARENDLIDTEPLKLKVQFFLQVKGSPRNICALRTLNHQKTQ